MWLDSIMCLCVGVVVTAAVCRVCGWCCVVVVILCDCARAWSYLIGTVSDWPWLWFYVVPVLCCCAILPPPPLSGCFAGSLIGLGFVTFPQEFWADYDEVIRKQNCGTGCYVDWDEFGLDRLWTLSDTKMEK